MKNTLPNNTDVVINIAGFSILLLLASSIIRVGACLYLPALPVIGKNLGISDAGMTLTLTVYFIVFALFSLVCGPFSDAFGRRWVILAGGAVFIVGSFICGLAQSNAHLLSGRVVQAIGASTIPGTSRAMIRDVGTDVQVVSLMGWMAVLGALLLVGAPVLGGIITEIAGWRYTFWFLVVFALTVLMIMLDKIPETLPLEKRHRLSLPPVLLSYLEMMTSPKFFMVILPVVFCFAFQGAYLAAAPFIFIKGFMLSPTQFGLSNIVIVIALTGGRFITVRTVKHHSAERAYVIGAFIALSAGIFFLVIMLGGYWNLYALLAAVAFFCLGFGVLSPIGLEASLTAFRDRGGMAAALQGFLVLGGTAFGSAIIALLMKRFPDLTPMSLLSIYSATLSTLIFGSVLAGRNKLGRKNAAT